LIIDVLFSEFIEHCAQHPTQHIVLILKKHTSKKNLTLLGEAPALAKTRTEYKKEVFFTSFELGGGWVGKPINPIKNTSFALGMRRACVAWCAAPKR